MPAGRSNFFDNDDDLRECFSSKVAWMTFLLEEFDEHQTSLYLSKKGYPGRELPAWLPRKPLLIGFILTRNLLDVDAADAIIEPDPAPGWDFLLGRICEREVNQVYLALEPSELRRIYGQIVTK